MARISRAVRTAIAASREPSHAAVLDWQKSPAHRALALAFADCPLDHAEPAAGRAEGLLADGVWAEALLDPLIDALRGDPFFEPPFKASRDRLRTGTVLFECPAATLTASVTSARAIAASPAPEAMVFAGRVAVTRYVRAGGATLRRWSVPPVTPQFSAATAPGSTSLPALSLTDGDVVRVDGRHEAQLLARATADVVALVMTIRAGAAPLIREHSIQDGALLRVASGNDCASRTEMLLAFLRLAGRADAGARFEEATRDTAFHLRWAAMREWLALDARAALPRLTEMAAGDPNSEVRAAATLTLTAVHRRLEDASCPA